MDKILHLLGLAKRGSRLAIGEEPVGAACRAKDCRLLLLASDAAENTVRRAAHFAEVGQCISFRIPCTKAEMGNAVGRNACAMLAVTDIGIASSVAAALCQIDREKYGEAAEKLSLKASKAAQRRREQKRHEQGKKAPRPYIPNRHKKANKETK